MRAIKEVNLLRHTNNLKQLRLDRNVNQNELAKAINATQASISQIENGTRKLKPSTIEKICGYLKCETSDLIITEYNSKGGTFDDCIVKLHSATKKQIEEINSIIDYVLHKDTKDIDV